MKTKGVKAKKTKKTKVEPVQIIETVLSTPEKPIITEIGIFGNQEMIGLINKVNEIIKFINQ